MMNETLENINKKFLEASLEEPLTEDSYSSEEIWCRLYDLDGEDPKEEKRLLEKLPKEPLILDRIPPHNLCVERAILGIYLINPDKRGNHDKNLSNKFYLIANRKIHKAMTKLKNLDLILLQEKLREQENDEMIGGMAYLAELHQIGKNTNPNHLFDYIKIIKKHSLRRDLIHTLHTGFRDAYATEKNNKNTIQRLYSELSSMNKE